MKDFLKIPSFNFIISVFLISGYLFSCKNANPGSTSNQMQGIHSEKIHKKPGSSFQDTLTIAERSAIFYQPDSIQLEKIKAITDSRIYDGSMHEYFYQIRNARNVMRLNWPQIKIIDAVNVRFLLFANNDSISDIVDLDQYDDTYGMFIYDPTKKPTPVELTNFEEFVYMYFKK